MDKKNYNYIHEMPECFFKNVEIDATKNGFIVTSTEWVGGDEGKPV